MLTKIKNSSIVDGTITSSKLNPSGITAGNYTNPIITVDNAGRVTSASSGVSGGPKITNIQVTNSSYTVLDDTAVDTAGGYIKITGTGFVAGCQVLVNNVAATSTTFVSSSEVRAQVPATAAGTYIVYLVNSDGGVAIRVNGVTFSDTPTWTTSSSLSGNNNLAISIQLQATLATTYALAAGSTLPTGLTLTSGGLLSGTVTGLTQETVYSFTVVAIDSENQDSPRTFTLTITVSDPYYKLVTLHLPGNGTNGAQNNTFLDSSTNNFTITRSGNTTQGTFSPFSQTGWGNYFNGSSALIFNTGSNCFAASSEDFTVEAFVYMTSFATNNMICGYNKFPTYDYFNVASGGVSLNINNTYDVAFNYSFSANTWYHIAFSRESNSVKCFVNGQQVGSGVTNSQSFGGSSITASIGNWQGGVNYFFTGYISNFRFVKGIAVYTGNFTVTSPLTATQAAGTNIKAITGTETALLTCQSNRFVDNSSAPKTITVNGTPSIQAFSPFNPTSSWSAAAYGGSGYFDGSGDYLTVPDNSAWAFSGDFTIEAWVYPIVTNSENPIVAQWGGPGNANFIFMYTSGNRLRLGQTNTTITGSTTSIYINQWSHVAVTRSGSTIRLFVNGVLDGTTGTISGAFLNSTNPLTIGSLDGGGIPLTSYISGVRILNGTALYTTSFTPSTAPLTNITNTSLLLNFTNAGIYDATSKNDLETVGNAQISTAVANPFGSSTGVMAFDGTGDYLLAPVDVNQNYNFGSGNFTVECWFYANSLSATTYQALMGCNSGLTSEWGSYVRSNGVFIYGSGATLTGGGTVSTGVWNHYAAARSGNTIRVFLNGTQVASATVTGTYINSSSGFRVAWDVNQNSVFNGYLQDLRITKGYARYVEGTGANAGKMVFNGTNDLALPTAAFQTL